MEALSEQSGCEGKANTEHLTHASKDGTDELNFKPLLHKVTFTEKNIGIPVPVYRYQYKYQVLPVLSGEKFLQDNVISDHFQVVWAGRVLYHRVVNIWN